MLPYLSLQDAEAALGRELTFAEKIWFHYSANKHDYVLSCHNLLFLLLFHTILPLPFMLMELSRFKKINKYKIQPEIKRSFSDMLRCYKDVMQTFLLVAGPLQILTCPTIKWMGIRTSLPLPSKWEMACQLLVYFIVDDYFNYWLHRWLHTKWGYERIHHVHHEYTATTAFAAPYVHWAEILILGIPSFLGPALIPGHMVTYWLWFILRQIESIDTHSGYEFPWRITKYIPFYGGAAYHDYHHYVGARSQSNFAPVFTYCDYVYGTNQGYQYQQSLLCKAHLSLYIWYAYAYHGITFTFEFWKMLPYLNVQDAERSLGRELTCAEKLWFHYSANKSDFFLHFHNIIFLFLFYSIVPLPYMFVELSGSKKINDYKIQPKIKKSFSEMFSCYKQVVRTFLLVAGPLQICSYPTVKWVRIRSGLPLPSWWEIFWQLVVYFIVEDYFNYWIHRLLHTKWGYEKIHAVHHEYTAPIGFAAPYAHWAEIIILGIPSFLGPLLVPGHIVTYWLWFILRQMEAIETHSGYEFPWSPTKYIPFYGGPKYHDYHHYVGARSQSNFASVFTYCDYIYGTDKGYRYYQSLLRKRD